VTPLVTLHLTVIARPRGQRASMASASARMTAARCSRGRSASPISGPKGLKLIGFSVWERRSGGGRNVTFPARQYAVNGERRSFALLRPITDVTAQNRLRDLVLAAYAQHEERSAIASES